MTQYKDEDASQGSACPSDSDLAGLLGGMLPDAEYDSWARHLEGCARCAIRFKEICDGDNRSQQAPPDVMRKLRILWGLQASGFYDHFAYRLLQWLGRRLRLSWWVIHFALYFGTWAAFITLVNVEYWFPNGRHMAWTLVLLGEFLFTTFMLHHLQRSAYAGLKLATWIQSNSARAAWLARYLAPMFWGWAFVFRRKHGKPAKVAYIRTWHVAVALLVAVYATFPFAVKSPYPLSLWDIYWPNLLCMYTQFVKCAMITAVLGHFWFLRGVVAFAKGGFESALPARQRGILLDECRITSVRVNVAVGASVGVWILGDALSLHHHFWCYLLSLGLLFMFAVQAALVKGVKLQNPGRALLLACSDAVARRGSVTSYRPLEVAATATSIVLPIAATYLGWALARLAFA